MDVLLSYFKVVLPRSFGAVVSNILFRNLSGNRRQGWRLLSGAIQSCLCQSRRAAGDLRERLLQLHLCHQQNCIQRKQRWLSIVIAIKLHNFVVQSYRELLTLDCASTAQLRCAEFPGTANSRLRKQSSCTTSLCRVPMNC